MQEEIGPTLVDLLGESARGRRVLAPDFADTPSSSYISHLVSLPLEKLLREPSIISSEATAVETELVNLCYREYTTFISVHKCSAAVQSAFDDFEGSLGRLLNSVPALEDECRLFAKSTQGIQTARGRAALVLEHQDKLLDLLEIPHLMDTCVRNGYYQEALELANHAEDLNLRCGVALTDDVAKEVDGVRQLLLAQLLAILREPVKLPTLVKAVTFLRRLGSLGEEELGLLFLTSRLHNYRVQMMTVERERGEPIRYVRKHIDLFREHVYDIISQFTAIFGESHHLSSFAAHCVSDLAQLITSYVPQISSDSASLSSVLVQLGYCALSFSRVGLDFALLVGEPFGRAILSTYTQVINSAANQLAMTLKTAIKNAAPPSEVLVDDVSAIPSGTVDIKESSQPPSWLTHFPALALFLNAHMSALNTLRLMAPSALLGKLSSAQATSIDTANSAVLQYLKQVDLEIATGNRPKHARTPSSPRAHLLRRNSETLLAPEVRFAKKRETQRICIAFAEAWRVVILLIRTGLHGGIFEEAEPSIDLTELDVWLDQQVHAGPRRTSELASVEEKAADATEGIVRADGGQEADDQPRTPPKTRIALSFPPGPPRMSPDSPVTIPDAVDTGPTVAAKLPRVAVSHDSDVLENSGQDVAPAIAPTPEMPGNDKPGPTRYNEKQITVTSAEPLSEIERTEVPPAIVITERTEAELLDVLTVRDSSSEAEGVAEEAAGREDGGDGSDNAEVNGLEHHSQSPSSGNPKKRKKKKNKK